MRSGAGDDLAAARIEAWWVLGALITAGMIAAFLPIVAEGLTKPVQLALSAPGSAIALWAAWRFPSQRSSLADPRPLFRRRRGSHFSGRIRSVPLQDREREVPVIGSGAFGLRPKWAVITLVFAGAGALLAARAAGEEDRWGAVTDVGLIGFVFFGSLLAVAGRAVVRLVTGTRAVVVNDGRIVLGAAIGYIPPMSIAAAELRRSLVVGDEVWLASSRGRVDVIRVSRFKDPDGLKRALGAVVSTPDGHGRSHRVPEHARRRGFAMARLDDAIAESFVDEAESDMEGPIEPAPRETFPTVTGDGPAAADLIGARRQWGVRSAVSALILLSAVVGLGVSFRWFNHQGQANDRLLANGTPVVAEVTAVDRSRRGPDSITVEFAANGREFERDIHSGWFSGFSRGLRGETVVVMFDEAAPGRVRLPEERNIEPMSKAAIAASGLGVILGLLSTRAGLHANRLLRSTGWQRGRFELRSNHGGTTLDLWARGGERVLRGQVAGANDSVRGNGTASYTTGKLFTAVLPDGAGRALMVHRRYRSPKRRGWTRR